MNFASRIFAEHAARRAQAAILSEMLDGYSVAKGISLSRTAQENSRTVRDFTDRATLLGEMIEADLPALAKASHIPVADIDPTANDYYDTRHKELATIQMVNGWSYAFMRTLGECVLIPVRKVFGIASSPVSDDTANPTPKLPLAPKWPARPPSG